MCPKSSKFLQVSENPRNFYKYQKILEIFTSIRKSSKFLQVSENVCNREMCATEGKYLLLKATKKTEIRAAQV